MKSKLTILGLVIVAVVFLSIIQVPVGGDCESGIKAVHLDTDPNDFCDDKTIEIDPNNGLQVKAIPDDSVLPAKVDSIFGAWTDKDRDLNTLAINNVYKATSDGFVTYWGKANTAINVYTDNSSSPTTEIIRSPSGGYDHSGGASFPVKKNHYWKIVGADTSIHWLPIGNGSCEIQ